MSFEIRSKCSHKRKSISQQDDTRSSFSTRQTSRSRTHSSSPFDCVPRCMLRHSCFGFRRSQIPFKSQTNHHFFIRDLHPESFSMTEGAQQAMRRTMEVFSETTRFALACNYSNKIIEPIQSRCAILRYTRLTDAQVCNHFNEIINAREF